MVALNEKPKSQLTRNWRLRTAELAIGISANHVQEYLFDCLLYPFAIFKLGLIRGGAVMSLLSLIACLLLLRFYDWSKRDWLGIEAIKGLKDYEGKSRIGRWLAWVLRRGDFVACVALSVRFDPFITTAYMRHGAFNGMTARDWRIFLLSWFISNGVWALLCYAGVETISGLWRLLFAS